VPARELASARDHPLVERAEDVVETTTQVL
jgi:hypothetical protein